MKHIFPFHVHRRTVYNSGYVNSTASRNFLQEPRYMLCFTIDLYIRIMNLCEKVIDVVSCFNWYSYREAENLCNCIEWIVWFFEVWYSIVSYLCIFSSFDFSFFYFHANELQFSSNFSNDLIIEKGWNP